jgi:hypothetical protein
LTIPTGIQLATPPLPEEDDIDMTYGIPNEGIMVNATGKKIPVGLPGLPPSMPSIPEVEPEDDMDREVEEIPDSIEQEENNEDIAVVGNNGCVCDSSGVVKCVPFHIAKQEGMIADKNPNCKADRECFGNEVPVCVNKNWMDDQQGFVQRIILQNDERAEEEEDMYGDTKYEDGSGGIDDDIDEVEEEEAEDIDDDIEEATCEECERGYTAGCYTKREISKYQLQETGKNICQPEKGECGLNEVVVCVENEKYDQIENDIEEENELKEDELIDETINITGGPTSFENVTEYLRQPVVIPPPSGPSGVQIIPPIGFEPGVYYPIRIRKKEDDSYLYGPDPKKPRKFERYE